MQGGITMYEFDSFVKSIIKDIKISNKQKEEIAEEFKDHLHMLKQEYVNKGYSEEEAVKIAIENFGNSKELKNSITYAMINFRKGPLIAIGLLLFIVIFKLCFLTPIGFSMTSTLPNYVEVETPIGLFHSSLSSLIIINLSITFVLATLLSFPLGYLLPILKNNIIKLRKIIFISLIPGIVMPTIEITLALNHGELNHWEFYIITSIIGSILGATLGYSLLLILNKLYTISTDIIYKKY